MSPPCLRIRILRALELGAQSAKTLARLLTASLHTVRRCLKALVECNRVSSTLHHERQAGRPWNLYTLTKVN